MYEQGFRYKLILTDFNMPEMDGIKSTRFIRSYLKNEHKLEKED